MDPNRFRISSSVTYFPEEGFPDLSKLRMVKVKVAPGKFKLETGS